MKEHKRYCMMQSLEGLKRMIEAGGDPREGLSVDGRPATWLEIKAAIEDAEAKGYDVLPTCDNVDERGHCRGHEK